MYINLTVLCLLILLFFGCRGGENFAEEQAKESDDKGYESLAEEQANRYGLDYNSIYRKAFSDEKQLRCFFLMTFLIDAGGTGKYSDDMLSLLNSLGEQRFLKVYFTCILSIQHSVLELLASSVGYDQKNEEWIQFQKRYKKIGKMILKNK